ncbi:MAG: hypothetical protein AAF990_04910 [Bacteroidota bacterium]
MFFEGFLELPECQTGELPMGTYLLIVRDQNGKQLHIQRLLIVD